MARKTRKQKKCDIEFAIPSYQRPETLRDKTLALLKKYKMPSRCITVFVADAEQKKIYEEILIPDTYGKIVVAIKGIMEVRNFIVDYYPKGKKIVSMDDDLKGILEYDPGAPRHERELRSLTKVVERGFAECAEVGASLWGVYPVANGFFMKPKITTDLRFIVGSFFGFINQKIKVTTGSKDDYERSILHYLKDGKVVRLNFISPQTAYYKEPGGMQQPGRLEHEEKAVEMLLKKYPQFVQRNGHRKSGFPEIKLKDKSTALC